jgi:hypothetical protein
MATKSSRLGAVKHARNDISSTVKGCVTPLFVMAFLPVMFPTAGFIGTPYFFKPFLANPLHYTTKRAKLENIGNLY